MQKIIPHLWFDKEAVEAANFYATVFPDSKITSQTTLKNTPSGDADIVNFDIFGYSFMAISAGPYFKINPAISFMINFDPSKDSEAKNKLDEIWNKLSEGGKILMPLDKYPFSEHYGWIEDKYGVSWQLIYTNPDGEDRPTVIPAMLFVGDVCGKTEEATEFYLSVFKDSKRGTIARYPEGMGAEKAGTIMFTDFMLENQWFVAMDSALNHEFKFTEAVSLLVNCDTQEEIDYYWEKLSSFPESEQCGWLKDKYGVCWQISPARLEEMFQTGTSEQVARVTEAFLQMKKFDLEALEKAFVGD